MPKRGVKTRNDLNWSEARYWGFIRSALRNASRRWPPIAAYCLNDARRAYKGKNFRQKWEYQCSECKKWKMRKLVQVDHIHPCGTLKAFSDLPGFCERLFCEKEGLRVLCKACHNKVTHGNKTTS